LYKSVLANSTKGFSKNIQQLIIIPDDTLNYISFEILTNKIVKTANQDFSKMPYLLYHFQIQYDYSATLLNENKKRQNHLKTNAKCLAFAPPYDNNQPMVQRGTMKTLRDGTEQLQGTSKEIRAIAMYFNGDFDQSETATKANFLKTAPDFGILHLAMHGEANYENEQFANLKFTNTKNQSEEEYLLYQNGIASMDLNAQLVVLSACETGLGKYIYGEGVASLGRSFMYAGVPSVVMSLWKVDDKATSQLMPYFYENLAAGMSKDKALHQAKLTFLAKEDFSKLHPHYWAGFVMIGDIQPIKKQTTWQYWLFAGLLIISFGMVFFIWRNKNKR
jgi:CHAT domain-containing protein